MKKLMFLFVMMFMTSVSAYSQFQERVILVDVVVNNSGKMQVWWRNHPLYVKEDNLSTPTTTTLTLDLWGYPFTVTLPGRNHSFRDYVTELRKEMRPIMPYLLNGSTEFYIIEAGRLPKSYYF